MQKRGSRAEQMSWAVCRQCWVLWRLGHYCSAWEVKGWLTGHPGAQVLLQGHHSGEAWAQLSSVMCRSSLPDNKGTQSCWSHRLRAFASPRSPGLPPGAALGWAVGGTRVLGCFHGVLAKRACLGSRSRFVSQAERWDISTPHRVLPDVMN